MSHSIFENAIAAIFLRTAGLVTAVIAGASAAAAFDERLPNAAAIQALEGAPSIAQRQLRSTSTDYAQLFGPSDQIFAPSAPRQNYNPPRALINRGQPEPRDTYIRSRDRFGNPGPAYRVLGVAPHTSKTRNLSQAERLKLKVAQQLLKAPAAPPTRGPLLLAVSIAKQTVTLYDAGVAVAKSPVSTGTPSRPTPTGIFSVIEKQWWHRSNLYSAAPMPFMQRITWSGVALHAGELPGYAASHGCIRLPENFALQLWGTTKIGARVIITRDEVAPIEIAHARLFTPKARAEPKPEEKAPPENNPQREEEMSVSVGAAAHRTAEHNADRAIEPVASQAPSPRPARSTPIIVTAPTFVGGGPRVIVVEHPQPAGANLTADEDETVDNDLDDATRRALQQVELIDPDNTVINGTTEVAINRPGQPTETLLLSVERMPTDAGSPPVSEPDVMLASLDASLVPLPYRTVANTQLTRRRAAPPSPPAEPSSAQPRVLRPGPVSVMISRKEQRMYVRKGLEPLFDVPINVANPYEPIGNHVFTAVAANDDQATLRWMVVSLETSPRPEHAAAAETRTSGGKRSRAPERIAPKLKTAAAARAALDRLNLPQDAVQRISEFVSVGATLIVSDKSLGRRAAAALDSDFTILTP